jgi:hypothetical protein
MPTENRVQQLYAQYTGLRQTGTSGQDAWATVQPETTLLPPLERNQLLGLLREWETGEGRKLRLKQANDPFQTQTISPEELKELRQEMNVSKGIRRIKPVNPAVAMDPGTICPACHTANPPGKRNCIQCGTALGWAGPGLLENDTHPLSMGGGEDARFGEGMSLHFLVHGANAVIRVRPGSSEMIVGRRSPDSVMIPDVDLSPYNADLKGVSRLHAGLRRHGQTVVITDMGSLNHTYVNEQRLHPHEVRVLHDRDEIRFGQLAMQVQFYREES